MTRPKVFIGFDADQICAHNVARSSAIRTSSLYPDVSRISLSEMEHRGLYTRPTWYPTNGKPGYWDDISDAPMSTGHAIARFLVPALCGYQGWALFTDGDVLFRRDLCTLFRQADPSKAVAVVQHDYRPADTVKMEGQIQTQYARKNWSSVMFFHCGHPANRVLTVELVNTVPGRDLHRFCWLTDDLIGALDPAWNFLVGHSDPSIDPAIVHFTSGVPNMPGYEHCAYADEWYDAARAAGYGIHQPPLQARA
jgi:hypothetical protein